MAYKTEYIISNVPLRCTGSGNHNWIYAEFKLIVKPNSTKSKYNINVYARIIAGGYMEWTGDAYLKITYNGSTVSRDIRLNGMYGSSSVSSWDGPVNIEAGQPGITQLVLNLDLDLTKTLGYNGYPGVEHITDGGNMEHFTYDNYVMAVGDGGLEPLADPYEKIILQNLIIPNNTYIQKYKNGSTKWGVSAYTDRIYVTWELADGSAPKSQIKEIILKITECINNNGTIQKSDRTYTYSSSSSYTNGSYVNIGAVNEKGNACITNLNNVYYYITVQAISNGGASYNSNVVERTYEGGFPKPYFRTASVAPIISASHLYSYIDYAIFGVSSTQDIGKIEYYNDSNGQMETVASTDIIKNANGILKDNYYVYIHYPGLSKTSKNSIFFNITSKDDLYYDGDATVSDIIEFNLSSVPTLNYNQNYIFSYDNPQTPQSINLSVNTYDPNNENTYRLVVEYQDMQNTNDYHSINVAANGTSFTINYDQSLLDNIYKKFKNSNFVRINFKLITKSFKTSKEYTSENIATLQLTGIAKTCHVGTAPYSSVKRAQVWIGDSSGKPRRCVAWVGNNGTKRCI